MILFLKLFIAHLLGDFVFQPEKWVKDKEKKKLQSSKLYFHIGIHALLLAVLLTFNTTYWLGALVILISHLLIDISKAYLQNKNNRQQLFFIDQALHILMLLLVTNYYTPLNINVEQLLTEQNLLLIACLLFVTYVAAILIRVSISKWNPEHKKEGKESLAKAGRYIGILERLFVFVFVITDNWEGVGFLLAAKSVFRFGDLTSAKDRILTEYILIGTLLSFGLAILTGILYSHFA